MKEFLHGWRRKAGVATLVMACAFGGMWVRSYAVYDFIQFIAFDRLNRITLCHGKIGWTVWDDATGMQPFVWEGVRAVDREPQAHDIYHSRVHDGDRGYLASYWQATIPLTFLSAYLILWKPRKRSSSN